jgi:hypothetical protein
MVGSDARAVNRTTSDSKFLGNQLLGETIMNEESVASDSAARRAARRAGYIATKSRWRKYSIDNHGDFMIVDPSTNGVVAGSRYDLTADEVVAWCRDTQ